MIDDDKSKTTVHPKYLHAHARRRLGLSWIKPKWKRKASQRRGPARKGL